MAHAVLSEGLLRKLVTQGGELWVYASGPAPFLEQTPWFRARLLRSQFSQCNLLNCSSVVGPSPVSSIKFPLGSHY